MAADPWTLHDTVKEYMGDGTVDLDNDTFLAGLATSTSNVSDTSVNGVASLTNEVTGNGYARQTLQNVAWTQPTAGTVRFDADDFSFTASGGSITARFAFIFDDTVTAPVADPILCHSLLDNTPADVEIPAGNTMTIQLSASGVFEAT